MALGLSNRNGGTSDEYGTFVGLSRQMGAGVIEGLLVAANATPNMTVYVQPGTGLIPTGTYPASYTYDPFIDTPLPGAAVAVGTAAASPRIDYIVLYIDLSVAPSTAGANVNNTNNIVKLADVQGTPAGSPSVPTTAQIQSTIGASNPYIILAQVAVGANVTTITGSNITDLRTFASDRNDTALGAASYVDNGGILTYTASTLNGNFTSGLAYLNVGGVMVPQSFSALSYSVTASQDTYFYVTLGNNTIQKTGVANNAASPTLPANSVWLGKAISGASAITSVTQGGLDSNGKVIYPSNNLIGAQQAWQVPTLLNSWVNYGSGFNTAAYMKDSMGFVHLRGMVKNGTSGAAIFQLPVGYRPALTVYSLNANGGASPYVGIVNVGTDGTVKNDTGANTYQSLDNVIFRAEQ